MTADKKIAEAKERAHRIFGETATSEYKREPSFSYTWEYAEDVLVGWRADFIKGVFEVDDYVAIK